MNEQAHEQGTGSQQPGNVPDEARWKQAAERQPPQKFSDLARETHGEAARQANGVTGPGPKTAPPQLPTTGRPAFNADRSKDEGLFPTFGDDFAPMERQLTPFSIVDALLKHPGRAVYEIMKGNFGRMCLILLAIAAVCMAGYGLIMGSFKGGDQLWAVPVKLMIGTFLSALICLPSLYILTSLSGGDQSLAESIGLMMLALALSGILLVGFAPIAWIFSQSTNTVAFMGGMHVLFWMCGIYFGLRLLITSFSFLNKRRMGVLTFWSVIFIVVAFQMATALRPLVGEFTGYELQGKKFFLAHWGECAEGKSRTGPQ